MTETAKTGFAAMDVERQRQIAREGGRAAHQAGMAHEFSPEEARDAGRKGGRLVSANRLHMAEIGRLGGRKSGQRRRQRATAGIAAGVDAPNAAILSGTEKSPDTHSGPRPTLERIVEAPPGSAAEPTQPDMEIAREHPIPT